jgi:VWFA-related protein
MLEAKRHAGARLLTLLSCLLLIPPSAAQDQTPVFRTETTLIEFTLIALDKDGNPVTDLKKEEIVVRDKGRPRNLALFRYEGGEQPRTAPKLPVGIFTNTPELTPGPPRNITAIVLDTLNTQQRDQTWVKAQAMRYLGALLPNTRVAVYLLGQT